jgi:bacteriorhodopsin
MYSTYGSEIGGILAGLSMYFLFTFGVVGVIFGTFATHVAASKNRNQTKWFIAGFLFNFIALIAIAGMGSAVDVAEVESGANPNTAKQRLRPLERT